jgi:hypothetical protein
MSNLLSIYSYNFTLYYIFINFYINIQQRLQNKLLIRSFICGLKFKFNKFIRILLLINLIWALNNIINSNGIDDRNIILITVIEEIILIVIKISKNSKYNRLFYYYGESLAYPAI